MAATDQKIAELRALLLRANAMLDEIAAPEAKVDYVDQSSCEPLTPRSYLEHAREGDYPTKKVGRRVLCRRDDFDAFLATSKRQPKVEPAVDADDDDEIGAAIDLAAERIARRGGRR